MWLTLYEHCVACSVVYCGSYKYYSYIYVVTLQLGMEMGHAIGNYDSVS